MYPVGSIYISIKNTNPQTYLTGTTWVSFGSGRTIVGVNSSDTSFNTVEKTGGEKTHQLTINEMPGHKHKLDPDNNGNTQYFVINTGQTDAGLGNNWWRPSGRLESTASTGGDQAHNNLQPYITVYMWKRTV